MLNPDTIGPDLAIAWYAILGITLAALAVHYGRAWAARRRRTRHEAFKATVRDEIADAFQLPTALRDAWDEIKEENR